MKHGKAWLAFILVLALLLSCPAAEETAGTQEEPGAWPDLNEAGFLDSGEFVFEDEKNGVWRYASDTLWIEIFRREQKAPDRVFDRTAGNIAYTFLAATISES